MPNLLSMPRILAAAAAIALPAAAHAETNTTTLKFAVTRDGDPIGASTIRLTRDGEDTVADVATHVQVKLAYITVYRYDQHETERWSDGRLLAMTAVTDDNGTVHKVNARNSGHSLSVDADGRVSTVDPAVIPVSLWNASLLKTTRALDPKTGELTPVSVIDRGEDQLVLQGRPTPAHHYFIKTGFGQDVWYDRNHRLVKVLLHAVDGSKIQYQPGG